MSLALGVVVDVFLAEAGEVNAVQAGMEATEVGATHVTRTRLGLQRQREGEGHTEINVYYHSVWGYLHQLRKRTFPMTIRPIEWGEGEERYLNQV